MLNFMSFGSGSSGNCYYLYTEGYGLLIDAGIGIRRMRKYFDECGVDTNRLNGILVTHEHADHVKSVGSMSDRYSVPVYATAKVHAGMRVNCRMPRKVSLANARTLNDGEETVLGGLGITPFHVPHDSFDNIGFLITDGRVTFCLMTDIGHVTREMAQAIGKADYLVIEANHDEAMLQDGPYPQFLKERVAGDAGHLSNRLCAEAIARYASKRLKRVWLCHLSHENNHPELARKTVEMELAAAGMDVEVDVLLRNTPSRIFTLK